MLDALVVTDDRETAEIVDATLQLEWPEGRTRWLRTGPSAIQLARAAEPSLIILDLATGSRDGFEALRALRRFTRTPLVVVTDGQNALLGEALEAGADEYVVRPICPLELSARGMAVLRRSNAVGGERPEVQDLEDGFLRLDFTRREARAGGQLIPLTAIEWRLLRQLVAAEGQTVSSQKLLSALHDGAREMTIYLRAYLRRLREKLEPDPDRPRYLVTERGVGYRFVRPVGRPGGPGGGSWLPKPGTRSGMSPHHASPDKGNSGDTRGTHPAGCVSPPGRAQPFLDLSNRARNFLRLA